jgi:hypothetical protein
MAGKGKKTSIKHLKIDKDQSTILIITVIATIITVFSLFALKALILKGNYQHRGINAKQSVVKQLQANIESSKKLVSQYSVFADQDPNLLGGSKEGQGARDGNNSRLSLDALPSKYDVPALASSIEKLLNDKNADIKSITIKDDPTANSDEPSPHPGVVAIPFSFQTSANVNGAQLLLQDFEKSIRPFDVSSIDVTGSDASLTVTINGQTYFQPAKNLNLSATKVVK